MNSVNLTGNLASDVELRDVSEELKVASFLLAVDRRGKDDGADFVRISTWNGQAESCATYLSKGKKVAIEGRLRSSTYEKDGERRYALEVVANRVEFLSPPPAGNGQAQQEAEVAAVAAGAREDDGIPF